MKKKIIAVILAALTALSVFVLPLSAGAASVDHLNDEFTSTDRVRIECNSIHTSIS